MANRASLEKLASSRKKKVKSTKSCPEKKGVVALIIFLVSVPLERKKIKSYFLGFRRTLGARSPLLPLS